jgi:2-desacetyl-2-hydroxyethyl bacteriochlorophyllide A dehydrogenase
MQALWLENKSLTLRAAVPTPEPQPGEALIQMRLAGICGTDLELLRGYYPYTGIPGHEFVGDVIEATDEKWIGERVVGEINLSCRKCRECLAGRTTHCMERKVLGIRAYAGVFAEYLTLPLVNLHRVPPTIPDDAAVFTEPLAAALEIQQQVTIKPDDRVLLLGSGRLGFLIAQTLVHTGCDLRVTSRQERVRQILIGCNIPVIYPEEIPEHLMDIVVDASGSPQGFELACRAVRPRGTIVLKSTYTGSAEVNLSALVVNEVTLIGSRCGPFLPALQLMESGQVDPLPLIDARYPLREGLAAFEHAARRGTLKVLLYPG